MTRNKDGKQLDNSIFQPIEKPEWYWKFFEARRSIESAQQSLLRQESVKAYKEITKALECFETAWISVLRRCSICDGILGEHQAMFGKSGPCPNAKIENKTIKHGKK